MAMLSSMGLICYVGRKYIFLAALCPLATWLSKLIRSLVKSFAKFWWYITYAGYIAGTGPVYGFIIEWQLAIAVASKILYCFYAGIRHSLLVLSNIITLFRV